jgi:hypothetical protein
MRENVRVDLERKRRGGTPGLLTDELGLDACDQGQGGRNMAQTV